MKDPQVDRTKLHPLANILAITVSAAIREPRPGMTSCWRAPPPNSRRVPGGHCGLPLYSPELNPAERFFQELRRAVEGEPYASLDETVAAVQRILEPWDADPERVRSLCGWPWTEDAAQTLPAALDFAA